MGELIFIFFADSLKMLLILWRIPYVVLDSTGRYSYFLDVDGQWKAYHINLLERYFGCSTVVSAVVLTSLVDDPVAISASLAYEPEAVPTPLVDSAREASVPLTDRHDAVSVPLTDSHKVVSMSLAGSTKVSDVAEPMHEFVSISLEQANNPTLETKNPALPHPNGQTLCNCNPSKNRKSLKRKSSLQSLKLLTHIH